MGKIYDLLPEGRESAVSAKDLARIMGFQSVRTLQYAIARERAGGAPILSDRSGGYYKSNDPDELRRFIRTLDSRAKNTARAAASARQALDAATGQTRMEGWFDG